MTEKEIIEKVQSGEKELYIHLVEKYQSMVFRTCIGFVHNKEDPDDLAQDIFINAYQSIHSFKSNSAFSTWLYRIAVNASLNFLRNKSRHSIFERIGNFLGSGNSKMQGLPVIDVNNPEQILISEEHRQVVQKALDSLPENQRIAIVLSKYDDLSQKEIAQVMNTTEGAVEALIQRAKANLRKKLKVTVGKK